MAGPAVVQLALWFSIPLKCGQRARKTQRLHSPGRNAILDLDLQRCDLVWLTATAAKSEAEPCMLALLTDGVLVQISI
jgi:hypothetical protein